MSDRQRKGGGRRRRGRSQDRREGPRRDGGPQKPAPQPQGQAQGQGQRNQRRPPDREELARRAQGGRKKGAGGADQRRPGRDREPRPQYRSVIVLPEDQAAPCPICGKPVRDAVSALGYGEERAPAHFDCVMESLRASRELGPEEQLCYLGGGNFGVVRFARPDGTTGFKIDERIPYEQQHERPQWRRDLDSVTRR